MGASVDRSRVGSALFGRARRQVLALLFLRPERSYFLREIVRSTQVGQGAVQRELASLVGAELVTRTRRGNQVFFQANPASPVYTEIRGLVVKVCGISDVVQSALAQLGNRVEAAFVYGSVVTGEDRSGSDVDVLVIGDAAFGEVVDALAAVETTIGRPVNPTVLRKVEFQRKLADRNHFLTKVMAGRKEVVIGDLEAIATMG